MLIWFEKTLVEFLQLPTPAYFNKKDIIRNGTIRLSKFRASKGWFLECSVWPKSGGRYLIHVAADLENKGWLAFWKMLNDFIQHYQGSVRPTPEQAKGAPPFLEADKTNKAHSKSYAEIVKGTNKAINSKPSSNQSKFWLRKET